jgi:hypothetical protein
VGVYGAFVLIKYASAFSRRHASEVWPNFCPSDDRGRRESRVRDAPAASRAKLSEAHERSHHRFTGNTQHSLRNGFNGFLRALPGVRILGCHRDQRIKVLSTRSGRRASANLAPATGARTTRLRRPQHAPFVRAPFVRSQAHESLPCDPRTRPTLPRPPHPAPRP